MGGIFKSMTRLSSKDRRVLRRSTRIGLPVWNPLIFSFPHYSSADNANAVWDDKYSKTLNSIRMARLRSTFFAGKTEKILLTHMLNINIKIRGFFLTF